MSKIRQHQPLRVPNGWTGQDRALVIQLEQLLNQIYAIMDQIDGKADTKADKSTTVTNVAYSTTNKKITKTINGTTTDVVTVSTIKSALGAFTWGNLANQS